MPHVLIHVESHDREGILPSQLDGIRITARGLGHERLAFVDATRDGVLRALGWERFASLAEFLDGESGPLVVFETGNDDVRVNELIVPPTAWIVIGPAFGLSSQQFEQRRDDVTWCSIPAQLGGGRDAVAIAMWELRVR